jgi:hypothetical protein
MVDSAYCEEVSSTTDLEFSGTKARCMPTYLIIGAQKSGTDELSVFLNRNTLFQRRMDGGQEVHFFDCVGRGKGQHEAFRTSCVRLRTSLINTDDPFSAPGASHAFSWDDISSESPFVVSLFTLFLS